MPAVGPTTKEQGTQFSLDDIELAYIKSGIAAIPNLGNTCYMNSTIQCLSHTLEMTDIFLCSSEDTGLVSSGEFCEKEIKQLFRTYYIFFCSVQYKKKEMWFQPDLLSSKNFTSSVIAFPLQALSENECLVKSICLSTLKEVMAAKYPQFRGNQQNDAQEFLIGDLHEEMRSKNRSPPEDVFIATEGQESRKVSPVDMY